MAENLDFEEMITEYHPIIYKICRVYSGNEDFDDLYQEMLINLWKSYPKFKGNSKLSTWLYRVVLNTGLTYSRNEKKHKNKVPTDHIPIIAKSISEEKDNTELQVKQLNEAIKQLKKNDRAIIVLYLEESSYEEIASIIGINVSNVGVKINRIKKRLFKILSQ